jgi:hypothetical protein
LAKAIVVLKANHVENLSQLSGLLDLLPTLDGLPEIAAKAVRGDPSVLIDLVDFLTEAWLRYRFGQAPTVDDARELARIDVTERLKSVLTPSLRTTYGRFTWIAPDGHGFFGPGRLEVVAWSKLRFKTDASTLLADILALNGVGGLPTLSRLWDLVPFSFVVDWFTNEGERLKAVDQQLLFAAMGIQWVLYGFKVSYFPTDDELLAYQLENTSSGEPFHVSMYVREKSLFVPRLRESRFDFLAPGKPNFITVGSFVWQTLRNA